MTSSEKVRPGRQWENWIAQAKDPVEFRSKMRLCLHN